MGEEYRGILCPDGTCTDDHCCDLTCANARSQSGPVGGQTYVCLSQHTGPRKGAQSLKAGFENKRCPAGGCDDDTCCCLSTASDEDTASCNFANKVAQTAQAQRSGKDAPVTYEASNAAI